MTLREAGAIGVAAVLAETAALGADELIGLPQCLGLGSSLVIPRGDDLGGADEVALGVVMAVQDGGAVVDRWGYSEPGCCLEAAALSAITSDASRDFGTSTSERLTAHTASRILP